MSFSDSHPDMSLPEQHGIQLRMAADKLEAESYEHAFRVIAAVLDAEELLAVVQQANTKTAN